MADQIQIRRDSSTNWVSSNPVVAQGELAYETDTGLLKVGNGTADWENLGYYESGLPENLSVIGNLVVGKSAVAGTQLEDVSGDTVLDFGEYQNFTLTLTGNTTLTTPSTETVGQSGFIVFIQDATGEHTVSLASSYETANGAGLPLSSTADATDIVPYVVAASGRILLGAPQLAFA